MRILPFKAIFPDVKRIESVDEFFGAMKEEFSAYKNNGWFIEEPSPAFYIYKIEGVGYHHCGLVSATDVRDALEGNIVKHEDTLAKKEANMLQLRLERGAMIKPVLLIHKSVQLLDDFILKWTTAHDPFQRVFFTNNQESHTIWQITQADTIEFLQDVFKKHIDKAYIGDGHHRSETSKLLFKSGQKEHIDASKMLTVYFSISEVKIFAFNRIIELPAEVSKNNFLQALKQYCNISVLETFKKPNQKHQMVLMMENTQYLLTWKDACLTAEGKKQIILDTYLLEKHVLRNVLDISDVQNDHHIQYVPALETLEFYQNMLATKKDMVAFFLNPLSPEDLLAVANSGTTIPAKSTWFQPRIKNAIISLSITR